MNKTFFGTYFHSLDEKNRLSIPSKLRALLTNKVFLMKGFEGCISIYSEEDFEVLNEKLQTLQFTNPQSRSYIRLAYSSVTELDIDKVNRITLTTQVKNQYKINTEVVILGVGDHIEIWDKQAWNNYQENADINYEINAEGSK